MSADLEKAKAFLLQQNCTCVLCKGPNIFSSQHRGVRPLLDFLDSEEDFSGFSAADKVVGKATAFLYCLLGVKEVYAHILSDSAVKILSDANIRFSCGTQVAGIRNRQNTGPCPMENATATICDPVEALVIIRNTLKKLEQ